MHEMQTTRDPESDSSAHSPASGKARWLLEGANKVVLDEHCHLAVYCHGVQTATLEGHVNTKELDSKDPPFKAAVYDFNHLYFSHTGSMLKMQGALLSDILGPAIELIRGRHRPVWDPRQGLDEVRILLPLENPEQLSSSQIFHLAIGLHF